MGFLDKLFGGSSRELKKIDPIVDKIEALDSEMVKLSDDELKGKTKEFKNRIKKAVKKTDSLIKDGKDTEAKITLKNVYKVLDKAAKKNVIKNKKADRIKSRLSKKLNKLTPNNVKTAKKGA